MGRDDEASPGGEGGGLDVGVGETGSTAGGGLAVAVGGFMGQLRKSGAGWDASAAAPARYVSVASMCWEGLSQT